MVALRVAPVYWMGIEATDAASVLCAKVVTPEVSEFVRETDCENGPMIVLPSASFAVTYKFIVDGVPVNGAVASTSKTMLLITPPSVKETAFAVAGTTVVRAEPVEIKLPPPLTPSKAEIESVLPPAIAGTLS